MKNQTSSSIVRRSPVGRAFLTAALSALYLLAAPVAFAQGAARSPDSAKTRLAYRAVPPVASQQAQVVFFRSPTATGGEAAHVYIDGRFHTALQPSSFTRFCLATGSHSLEAHIGDAPKFAGKSDPRTRVNLEGGKTYFVAVSEGRSGEPVPMVRSEAEKVLPATYEQHHFVNRASAVVPCQEAPEAAPQQVRYTLNADVLFAFAKSDYGSITERGREELRKVAQQIREQTPSTVTRLKVRGHADPIGSAASNLVLSEQRARTVARVLSEEGLARERLSVEGVGSAEPVVSCPSTGSKQARVACNQPNRRVEVVGEGVR